MKNIFDPAVCTEVITRIESLKPTSAGLWGKMTVAQMLAHCCVSYEMVYENRPKPNFILKYFLKTFVKPYILNEKPFKKNERTANAFIIAEDKDFETEKDRLVSYIWQTQALGANYFDGKESISFGSLTKQEWNILFYKHLDHHLQQFGV